MSKTIIVGDDEPNIRNLVRLYLERDGHTVYLANDGEQVIHMALAHKPDLILLDILMPGMDGPTAAALLQEDQRTSRIPIIFLTSLAACHDKAVADEQMGGYLLMPKPINEKIFLPLVRQCLGT